MELTIGVYVLFALALGVIAWIDAKSRRIPNGILLELAALWVLWRLGLGLWGVYEGAEFGIAAIEAAPLTGITLSDGVVGALVLGGGLLIMVTAFEAATHRQAMGGGDIKLMTLIGLYLGPLAGLVCLVIACVLAVVIGFLPVFAPSTDSGDVRGEYRRQFLSRDVPFGPPLAVAAWIVLGLQVMAQATF